MLADFLWWVFGIGVIALSIAWLLYSSGVRVSV